MQDEDLLRLKRLDEISEQDEIYRVWYLSYLEIKKEFEQYAANQPDEIYRLLHGYADCWAMALQRKVFLACTHMIFPDENNKGAD